MYLSFHLGSALIQGYIVSDIGHSQALNRFISYLALTYLGFLHRELDLVDRVRIVLVTQFIWQPEVQLPAWTDDVIAILVDPFGESIVGLTNSCKWTRVNNASHFLRPRQVIDLDTVF